MSWRLSYCNEHTVVLQECGFLIKIYFMLGAFSDQSIGNPSSSNITSLSLPIYYLEFAVYYF
jgi:hypothetical protein